MLFTASLIIYQSKTLQIRKSLKPGNFAPKLGFSISYGWTTKIALSLSVKVRVRK